ncbi:MAG: 5'-nucleotidase C-terminal domain-containing protein [Rhodospirillales bacterium]|nr:MAG: 5'-nucleotidase C-terminal domain-containing protein [Rhodospirillales bacterium]
MGIIRRFVALLAPVILVLAALGAPSARAGETRISLVLICDIYKMAEEDGRGGMARIAAAVKAEKARGGHVLVAHAGDTLSPSLMSGLDKGRHMVELMNMMPIDVFVPGNHEFDFGPDVFIQRMREMKAPIFAANLREADGSRIPGFIDARIMTFGEARVGVIGLTAEDSPKKSQPERLRFAGMVDTLREIGAHLRKEGADLIVLVSHSNRDIDDALVDSGAAEIILSGDDHDVYLRHTSQTAIIEAGQDGQVVAVVDLSIKIDTSGGGRKVSWWPRFRFIDTADVQPDPAVAARVAAYEAELSKELDGPLGRNATELDSRNSAVRGGEAAIGNLFADALRSALKTDVALINGGGFRGNRVYPAGGELTRKHLLGELPFLNKALVLELTGRQLVEALEAGFTGAENETGRFPQVSGMTIRADLSRPNGARVVSVAVDGKPLDPGRRYTLATNDFLATGGDGYDALKQARVTLGPNDAELVANHVMAHIRTLGTVSPRIEGRTIVGRERAPRQ